MDCSPVDMINIVNFTQRMVRLAEFRQKLSIYLADKMKLVAPNLSTLLGDTVAARLISKAGSLTNLAKAPASTVQILGAEKALFRALKTRGNTPKYGLIFHSSFIGRAGAKNKGRISRYLANKCSIASRIDAFSEDATTIFGSKLKEQVEERLKFYETGDLPRKNVDVMNEAVEEAADELKKKKKKRKAEEASGDTTMDTTAGADTTQESADGDEPPKKKKKKKNKENEPEAAPEPVETVNEAADESVSKKKKKKKNKEEEEHKADVSLEEVVPEVNGSEKKKKKKKNKAEA